MRKNTFLILILLGAFNFAGPALADYNNDEASTQGISIRVNGRMGVSDLAPSDYHQMAAQSREETIKAKDSAMAAYESKEDGSITPTVVGDLFED